MSTGTAGTSYTEVTGGAYRGNYHGTHFYNDGPYQAYTYQVAANIPNGLYSLRAWIKNNGGQSEAVMVARGYGGAERKVALPLTTSNWAWTLIEIKDIPVTSGQCEIGFRSAATAPRQTIYFDDVQLFSQTATPTTELRFVTRNTYDTSGRLLATESAEAGRTEYVYARDGRIRFSQSALQRPTGRFSYSNYDEQGRAVESGEYTPSSGQGVVFENQLVAEQTPAANSVLNLLEDRTPTGGLDVARCSQRNRVWYDEAFDASGATPANALTGRTQEFIVGSVSKTQNDQATTWYSYDDQGLVTWVVQDIVGLGTKKLDYKYDFAGNVLEVAYQHGQPDAFHHYYQYDRAQRLDKVYTSPDGAVRTLQAQYFYYLHGPLKRVELADRLQGIDYTYTLQGWLKSINHVNARLDPGQDSPAGNGLPKDLFGLTLDYFSGDYRSRAQAAVNLAALAGTAKPFRYDGTVRTASWRTPAGPKQYVYDYDAKSQLTQSDFGTLNIAGTPASSTYQLNPSQAFKEGGLSYDPNGNLKALRRTNQAGQETDNFHYEYTSGTNRLKAVHGGGSPTGAAVLDYDYDALGQMTRQRDEQGQRYLTYDVTGKTTGVYLDAAHQQPVVTFAYDDRGFRVSKKSYGTGASAGQVSTTYYVRDADGNVMSLYEQGPQTNNAVQRSEVPLYGATRVGVLTHIDNGTTTGIDDARYELNDQLGDARVVFHRPTTATYTATLEPAAASQEERDFTNVATTRFAAPGRSGSTAVARLGLTSGLSVGPSKTLSVQQGDTITFTAYTWLTAALVASSKQGVTAHSPSLVVLPATAPAPPTPADDAEGSAALRRVRVGVNLMLEAKADEPLANGIASVFPGNARLHYIVRDKDNNVLTDEYQEANPTAPLSWQQLQVGLRLAQGGTVELSVETAGALSPDVYFDDVRVEQTGSLIVQEQHQYAYGSPLVGLNYAVGNKRYRYGYQGQYAEKDAETGFESFELRLYNSRIGRWSSYDPEGQFSSPYVGMGNNPISVIDPNGGWGVWDKVLPPQ
jgi:RHS repeat-associated protein